MATFKARARALDMLGRQQIAGIPTAISELFKNAHDAYADRVEVDFYRSDGLFILRDDGLGMTEEEFTTRWLTLGTESKLRSKGMLPPPVDVSKPPRQMLGEKGVGRLAIAIIGPQVLVITRAKRDGKLQDTVAAFIHWGLFECPGVDLDQIEIPIRTFSNGIVPSYEALQSMIEVFRGNIKRLNHVLDDEVKIRINTDLDAFDIAPDIVDGYAPGMSLTGEGHGTHFIIKPTSEMLMADLDEWSDGGAPNLIKLLGGFTNTMTPDHSPPVIQTAFRDHKTEDMSEDLIEEGKFFTPSEFEKADHQFRGEFDEFGQFRGMVSIYGQVYNDHIVSWNGGHGFPARCGPFSIQVANVQGASRESTLALQDWNDLISKMNNFGGLYIYRDGVRVLPYGNNDFDWLDIERNRTKSAGYYFFSYRRMFGVVEIKHGVNGALTEKAGREGFRENGAYRDFKAILQNFFVQLAADFFRDQSPDDRFQTIKEELNRQDSLRKRREELTSSRKKQFKEELATFFQRYDAAEPEERANSLLSMVQQELSYVATLENPADAAEQFLKIEDSSKKGLADLERRYKVSKPRGVGFPKNLLRDWDSYLVSFDGLQHSVFIPTRQRIEQLVGERAAEARVALDYRLRIERSLGSLSDDAKRVASQERKATHQSLEQVRKGVVEAAQSSTARVKRTLDEVYSEFARLNVSDLDETNILTARERLETTLLAARDREREYLQAIRGQLDSIDFSGEGGSLDQMEAVEQRAIALEEQSGIDLQLTQLGMAIEVINHEFDSSVRAIRENVRRLKGWGDVNPVLGELYQGIRNSFDHLDGYLTLFTPLHRRLYRNEIVMSGADIRKFLVDLFSERFRRHEIHLKASDEFCKNEIVGFPSSFYPVFVNLVDNAVFWLKDKKERVISLDVRDGSLVVADTGPGIPVRDRSAVFELGFSRKPGGRGMGLHISREVLSRVDYDLIIADSTQGAEFHISPRIKEAN